MDASITNFSLLGQAAIRGISKIDNSGVSISVESRSTTFNTRDDQTGSDPVLIVVHGTNDPTVPYSEAIALENWAISAGLPLDFQAVAGAGHAPSLHNNNAIQDVTLFQRGVDFHHETVFAGLNQGPQPALPPGC